MPVVITPRDPNNLRNRWRRMRDAYAAYGWPRCSFREWYRYGVAEPTAYSAGPHHLNFNITLRNAKQ